MKDFAINFAEGRGFSRFSRLPRVWISIFSAISIIFLFSHWLSSKHAASFKAWSFHNETSTGNHGRPVDSPAVNEASANETSVNTTLVKAPPAIDPLSDIHNTTLGFQRVFAINFPGRRDKKDAMIMGASFTDFDIDWIDAVSPADIPDKALPPSWQRMRDKPNELGCWRSHMTALQRVVELRLSSALIFEDDSDWDVSFKAQMTEFARGARAIQNTTGTPFSPYGDDWDMFWLGHCNANPRGDEKRFYVIPHDPTVRPQNYASEFGDSSFLDPFRAKYGDSNRVVFEQVSGVCLNAYAVSFNGARKILKALSMSPLNDPIDLALIGVCGGPNFRCIAPYPRLVTNYVPEGPNNKNSDLNDFNDDWRDAYSAGIVYSTMLNIPRMLAGEETVQAQYPESAWQFINPKDVERVRGRLEVLPEPQPEEEEKQEWATVE